MSAAPCTTTTATISGRAEVDERRGRLILKVWTQTWESRQALIEDLRQAFPSPADCRFRTADGSWIFPVTAREQLERWLLTWFTLAGIDWPESKNR